MDDVLAFINSKLTLIGKALSLSAICQSDISGNCAIYPCCQPTTYRADIAGENMSQDIISLLQPFGYLIGSWQIGMKF